MVLIGCAGVGVTVSDLRLQTSRSDLLAPDQSWDEYKQAFGGESDLIVVVKTDFARMLWEGEAGAKVAKSYPLQRLGEVADIANAALYLASEASSWMTGQHLVLDGGGQVAFSKLG